MTSASRQTACFLRRTRTVLSSQPRRTTMKGRTRFSILNSIEAGFDLPCRNHACDSGVSVMSDLFGEEQDESASKQRFPDLRRRPFPFISDPPDPASPGIAASSACRLTAPPVFPRGYTQSSWECPQCCTLRSPFDRGPAGSDKCSDIVQ